MTQLTMLPDASVHRFEQRVSSQVVGAMMVWPPRLRALC